MADNLLMLQRFEQALGLIAEQLPGRLVEATLTPTLTENTYTFNCAIKNDRRGDWITETYLLGITSRVGNLLGLGIVPGTIIPASRPAGLFKPYTEIEVLDFWLAQPSYKQDELVKDQEAARILVRLKPDVLWGWIPGHVLEVVGQQVKVRLERELFREGGSVGQFASLGVNAWGLRLAGPQSAKEVTL